MKKKMIVWIAAVLYFVGAGSLYVNGEEFKDGNARLSGNLADGTPVQIDVRTAKLTPQYPYKDAFMWGGEFESESKVIMPKTVIKNMLVRIGKKRVFVPLSAYCDLGDPAEVSLEKDRSGFKLVILGGRYTASGYEALLTFEDEHIQRRKVRLRIFPDDVWAQTVYSFISKNDER